jgi:hypothetical protein
MATRTRHSPILIAISYQALNRARARDPRTQECDCTVVIVFAGFYLEADLNDLIRQLGREADMLNFFDPRRRRSPGLQNKLAWLYNEYAARKRATNRETLYKSGITAKLRRRFPGFAELYRFRNDVSHGVVNAHAKSLQKTESLRQRAKDISKALFEIAVAKGHNVAPSTDYWGAIGLHPKRQSPNKRLQPTARASNR